MFKICQGAVRPVPVLSAAMTIAENKRRSPAIDWLQLEPVLHLDPLGADRFAANTLSPNMSGAIFGGQYIANVVGAAMLTAGDHAPHMMQAFFLRAGDLSAPLQLSVQRVRDGRRFSHRRVEVQQNGRLLMTADVSLYQGSGHNTHQIFMSSSPGTVRSSRRRRSNACSARKRCRSDRSMPRRRFCAARTGLRWRSG
jgi:acyl-CoA thioesterase II